VPRLEEEEEERSLIMDLKRCLVEEEEEEEERSLSVAPLCDAAELLLDFRSAPRIRTRGMLKDFGWVHAAKKYVQLMEWAMMDPPRHEPWPFNS